jgi:hypothetical protein
LNLGQGGCWPSLTWLDTPRKYHLILLVNGVRGHKCFVPTKLIYDCATIELHWDGRNENQPT